MIMHIPNLVKSSVVLLLLYAGCTPGAQTGTNSAATSSDKVWRKDVARMIDMAEQEDTVVHHLKDANSDSSFIVLVINAIKAGQLTAYSNVDHSFSTKFTIADLNQIIAPKRDTVVVTDPVNGDEIIKIVVRDFDFDMIHKYRVLENWAFDPASGKTEIQIAGIAPIREVIGDDGAFRGIQALFWLKYDDVKGILARCGKYHPTRNLNTLTWDDYFLSDTKPAAVK
jgi:gliding motility-associated GldN-like protein